MDDVIFLHNGAVVRHVNMTSIKVVIPAKLS